MAAKDVLGRRGEDLAVEYLTDHGLVVLSRNWRCRDGELDLVLERDSVIVFCEVKTRSSDRFGAPVEAITRVKQRRLRVLAAKWLDERRPSRRDLRFDVASVMRTRDGRITLDVLEGAF